MSLWGWVGNIFGGGNKEVAQSKTLGQVYVKPSENQGTYGGGVSVPAGVTHTLSGRSIAKKTSPSQIQYRGGSSRSSSGGGRSYGGGGGSSRSSVGGASTLKNLVKIKSISPLTV